MRTQSPSIAFSLRYLKTVGILNSRATGRGFVYPYDLAVSRDGRIFVLNRCPPIHFQAVRVEVCTLDDDYLGEFGNGYGEGDGQFVLPTGMAFDSEDRLHIADEGTHRISAFDTEGAFLGKWGEHGSGDGQLNGPSGIAIDSNDNAYVVDQHNHRVQVFTRDGQYIRQWGEHGHGDGQFNLPWGVTVDSEDNVYVADWRNDRIQKFTADGRFIAKFGDSGDGDGQLNRPADVAVDGEGHIYVADWGNERVQVLGPDGSFLLKLRGQATLSKWATEFMEANPDERDTRAETDLVPPLPPELSSPYRESSQIEPYFWGAVSVTLDAEGRLYVTESNRQRFQVYERVRRGTE